MDDPECRIAVPDGARHDPERDEVVHLLEADLLALDLLADAVETLDPPIDANHRDLSLAQFGRDSALQLLDRALGRAALALDPRSQRLVHLWLQVLECQLLQFVPNLAHPKPVGERRVDIEGLLRDLDAPLFGKVVERAHVVQTIC